MPRRTLPQLPKLLARKIYKTGQTRGADDDEIYQNRVSRNSTVLIPFPVWIRHFTPAEWARHFEKGYIVLLSPAEYFDRLQNGRALADSGLELGENALVFYETRAQWLDRDPTVFDWTPAESRIAPLRGQYVARISATTATDNGAKILRGFETTANKGAGIRVYEYANDEAIEHSRLQLEALFWLCIDAETVVIANGMTEASSALRKREILTLCEQHHLLDYVRFEEARIVNRARRTICPLCLEELPGQGFFSRMEQAVGREVLNLTVTQLNLFHIDELRPGSFNHRPYNLGWGHHHCNVVVRDKGIVQTLAWMREVIERNTAT